MADEEPNTGYATYTIESTSYKTAQVDDIELSVSPAGLTRKVLRSEIIENDLHPENSVEICLVHQKRATTADEWGDIDGPKLTTTKPNAPSKFPLKTAETKAVFDHLANLYHYGEDGVRRGKTVVRIANEDEVIQTDASRARLINTLLGAEDGEEVWQLLVDHAPNLAHELAVARVLESRMQAIKAFEDAIGEEHNEDYWQQSSRQTLGCSAPPT